MGYIRDGRYIRISSQDPRLTDEILAEIKLVFEERFGRRYTESGFNNLSSQEINDVTHVASVRVQERRRQ